ncbi:MAG: right-handed parallel beta-helix repeat-containing protein, partial [Planctomycetota bacterium]
GGYGGAIYYAVNCVSQLNGCTFADNLADLSGGGIYCSSDNEITVVDSNFAGNSANSGGALYLRANCSGAISYTTLLDNDANDAGGALYLADSNEFAIADCNISFNKAPQGAGVCAIDSPGSTITDCMIQYNGAYRAIVTYQYFTPDPNNPTSPLDPEDPNGDPNDPNVIVVEHEQRYGIGEGGGIFAFNGPALIANCQISYNTAMTSGGGLYLGGNYDLASGLNSELNNCLITNNRAGRDGAGVSANWFLDAIISNCTIADNQLMQIPGYGGGLYCSYESHVEVIDSIIWGNVASQGSQIAVASGDWAYQLPSTVTVTYSDIQVFQEDTGYAGPTGPVEPVEPIDPCAPDYFIYSEFDTNLGPYSDSYGLYGWKGTDGIDRIIHYGGSYDPNTSTYLGVNAYIHTVTIPEGANPHSHPNNPYALGEIAPRTFTLERSFDLGSSFVHSHASEFYVDPVDNEIYVGAYQMGILKYVFDSDANNPVEGGPAGNYVYDSQIAPPTPSSPTSWRTESLAYDWNNDIWYAGGREISTIGEVWKYDGSQGPSGNWELAFTYAPPPPIPGRLYHHDGMAFANGHLFLATMYGDLLQQFTPDGRLVNVFTHEPLARELESMGWGALQHFWVGSFGPIITEFGGGALQFGIDYIPASPPIYVEQGCTLNGWEPNDPNNFFTWDVNSWVDGTNNIDENPNFTNGYYLSQPVAKRDGYSPCVDAGSGQASDPNIAMDAYTTRIDGVNDVNVVDMGYHYNDGIAR